VKKREGRKTFVRLEKQRPYHGEKREYFISQEKRGGVGKGFKKEEFGENAKRTRPKKGEGRKALSAPPRKGKKKKERELRGSIKQIGDLAVRGKKKKRESGLDWSWKESGIRGGGGTIIHIDPRGRGVRNGLHNREYSRGEKGSLSKGREKRKKLP